MRSHVHLFIVMLFGLLTLSACMREAPAQTTIPDMQPTSSAAMPTAQTPLESTTPPESKSIGISQSSIFPTAVAGEVYFLVDGIQFRLQHKVIQQDGGVFLSLHDICATFIIESTLLLPSVTLLNGVEYIEASHLETLLAVTVEVFDYSNLYVCIYKSEPLYSVYLDGEAGYIDNQGAVILEGAQYTTDFSNGIGCVDNRYYVNANGETVITVPDGFTAFQFSDGLAAVLCHETEAIGFIDLCGNLMIDFQHLYASEFIPAFHEGFACIYNGSDSYFINPDGIAIGTISDMAGFDSYSCGRLVTFSNIGGSSGYCVYDSSLNMVKIFGNESTVYAYKSNIALVNVHEKEHAFYYVDLDGEPLFGRQFQYATSFVEGLAFVRDIDICGLIDTSGRLIKSLEYDEIYWCTNDYFAESPEATLVAAVKDDRAYILDRNGNEISIPAEFAALSDYGTYSRWYLQGTNGSLSRLAVMGDNNAYYYGYIDTHGNMVVPPRYEYTYPGGN